MARVLFVDYENCDTPDAHRHLGNSFDVLSTADTSEALHYLLDKEKISVLITELHMPGVDGFQFLEQVRSHSPHTCRIVLTAHPSIEDMHALMSDELAFRYMIKPCPPFKLHDTLREGFAEFTKGFRGDGYHTATTSVRNIRKMRITHLKYGDEIACHIKNEAGRVLVSSGTVVDGIMLNKLKSLVSEGQIDDTLTIFGHP